MFVEVFVSAWNQDHSGHTLLVTGQHKGLINQHEANMCSIKKLQTHAHTENKSHQKVTTQETQNTKTTVKQELELLFHSFWCKTHWEKLKAFQDLSFCSMLVIKRFSSLKYYRKIVICFKEFKGSKLELNKLDRP